MKSNLVTREDVQKTFNDAFKQMKNYYMLMDVDDQYYYFKHKLTRQSSLRPVCVAHVEEASLGLLERFRAKWKIAVKTYRASILTHRVNLV